MAKQISLHEIRIDGETQMRQQIDSLTVADYANAFASGVKMPDVVVFHDGATNWLADGFHRWHGAKKAGMDKIACDVRAGSQRDAILYAIGANDANGLRRLPADKRMAVMKLLNDPEWSKRSNRWIADAARVSDDMVSDWRKQSGRTVGSDSCNTGQDGRTTGRDGKKRRKPKKKPKKLDVHVPPIDDEIEATATIPSPVAGKKLKTFDNEKQLIRQLVAMVAAVRSTRFDVEFDKGRLVHELNEWANYIAEQTESAEEAA